MGRAANYFKLPTFRQVGIPAETGTGPVFGNLSPNSNFLTVEFQKDWRNRAGKS